MGFALADNKIALNSDWDMEQLKLLWQELSALELNFDLEVTGFETAEIDLLIDGPTVATKADRSDIVPERAERGRLPAGRSLASRRTPPDLRRRLRQRRLCRIARWSEQARMVFTDPPYNVPIDGHVGGLGAVKHREFKMASGEMSPAEFQAFLKTVIRQHGRR